MQIHLSYRYPYQRYDIIEVDNIVTASKSYRYPYQRYDIMFGSTGNGIYLSYRYPYQRYDIIPLFVLALPEVSYRYPYQRYDIIAHTHNTVLWAIERKTHTKKSLKFYNQLLSYNFFFFISFCSNYKFHITKLFISNL